jgi:hypothetical protein
MRKWVVMSVIGGLALIPALAFADVHASAWISKHKDIWITENLDIDKEVEIEVEVELNTKKAAESNTLVNQENHGNLDKNFATGSVSVAVVGGSGIVNANNASGNMNNQANAVSVAVDPFGFPHFPPRDDDKFDPNSAFAHSQAAADQDNHGNVAINLAAGSFASLGVSGSGIVSANNASGSMNNQANATSVAVGAGSLGVALSEADLGQVNSYNVSFAAFYGSQAGLSTAGSGIINANNSSGHMNNQANVVSVAAVNGSATSGQ